jgi:hypothetical protein
MLPRNRAEERWRLVILMELNSVSENLNPSKSCRLRTSHRKLFEHVETFKRQRNWITHQHGLVGSRLDWMKVWHTVNTGLENRLLPELTRVIEKENSMRFNSKARHSKHDSEDTIKTQTGEQSSSLTSEDNSLNERHVKMPFAMSFKYAYLLF